MNGTWVLEVLVRDGWKCRLCGVDTPEYLRGTDSLDAPEIGHIVPRIAGGEDTSANLRCECRYCNRLKGTLTDFEFLCELLRERKAGKFNDYLPRKRVSEAIQKIIASGGKWGRPRCKVDAKQMRDALNDCKGNIRAAAKKLEISYGTAYRLSLLTRSSPVKKRKRTRRRGLGYKLIIPLDTNPVAEQN